MGLTLPNMGQLPLIARDLSEQCHSLRQELGRWAIDFDDQIRPTGRGQLNFQEMGRTFRTYDHKKMFRVLENFISVYRFEFEPYGGRNVHVTGGADVVEE
jgi:hypothetical protein